MGLQNVTKTSRSSALQNQINCANLPKISSWVFHGFSNFGQKSACFFCKKRRTNGEPMANKAGLSGLRLGRQHPELARWDRPPRELPGAWKWQDVPGENVLSPKVRASVANCNFSDTDRCLCSFSAFMRSHEQKHCCEPGRLSGNRSAGRSTGLTCGQ